MHALVPLGSGQDEYRKSTKISLVTKPMVQSKQRLPCEFFLLILNQKKEDSFIKILMVENDVSKIRAASHDHFLLFRVLDIRKLKRGQGIAIKKNSLDFNSKVYKNLFIFMVFNLIFIIDYSYF